MKPESAQYSGEASMDKEPDYQRHLMALYAADTTLIYLFVAWVHCPVQTPIPGEHTT